MFDSLIVKSYKGNYHVHFNHEDLDFAFSDEDLKYSHFIIDKKVASVYQNQLKPILNSCPTLLIDANEKNKSLESFPHYIEYLVKNKLRKNHRLIAIGGGIIQDITSFISATVLRGVNWWFYPTTLLSQTDSCIGSKSSVNCGPFKNILGTFTPPEKIFIHTHFLKTLDTIDFQSGVGEMLKVHAIEGTEAFNEIANDYHSLHSDPALLLKYIKKSLIIKKSIIEQDEFDQDLRKILNYGHTFGHAIESATDYRIPHGIAITIGMDMANYISHYLNIGNPDCYRIMHSVLKKNYSEFINYPIPLDKFMIAIASDKKNEGKNQLGLILVNQKGKPALTLVENNKIFQDKCAQYFASGRLE